MVILKFKIWGINTIFNIYVYQYMCLSNKKNLKSVILFYELIRQATTKKELGFPLRRGTKVLCCV